MTADAERLLTANEIANRAGVCQHEGPVVWAANVGRTEMEIDALVASAADVARREGYAQGVEAAAEWITRADWMQYHDRPCGLADDIIAALALPTTGACEHLFHNLDGKVVCLNCGKPVLP